MTWEQAFKKIVKEYFDNVDEEDTSALGKISKSKYNKKYFDTFAKEQFGETEVKDKKSGR